MTSSDFIRSVINDDLALVATLTFFVCEALFNALPDFRARLKQLMAIIVGGVLGAIVIESDPLFSVLHGMLSGGAATTVVARFKSSKSIAVAKNPEPVLEKGTMIASVDPVEVEHASQSI